METLTTQQAVNRGFNLLATSVASLAGFAFLPEAFFENDFPDKIDDILLFVIALVAMFWYNHSQNRYVRSFVPVLLVIAALVVKIIGIIIEHDDAQAVGDDFGGLILFVLATGLVVYQYIKSRKI